MGEKSAAMRPVEPLANGMPADEDPAAIRAEIEETRAEMSETIDALQEKLSPQRIMDEAKQSVHDATVGKVTMMMNTVSEKVGDVGGQVQDRAEQAVSYVRENPVPALLIGAGITWLIMRSRDSKSSSYSGYVSSTGHRVPRATPPPSGAQSGWTGAASDAAERVQRSVSSYGRSAETTIERWLRENPLTVGTVALAAGALVGLGLPRTRTEDAWMGEARDTVVERAQETAQSAVERSGEIADQVTQQAEGGTDGGPPETAAQDAAASFAPVAERVSSAAGAASGSSTRAPASGSRGATRADTGRG